MKRFLIAIFLTAAPVNAQVSSTAAPVANSSGSVTNMAVQNIPSRQFTNTYGGGVSCQGATLSIGPFMQGTTNWSTPTERYYDDPVYNTRDLEGAFDVEGNPMPDGVPDLPGEVLFMRPIRTGQKTNLSLSAGIAATISIPLDRHHVKLCRKAAQKNVELLQAQLADKRLNYEIARIKSCSRLLKDGVIVHPSSPFSVICADVMLVNPPGVLPPHIHPIPKVSMNDVAQESPDSYPAEQESDPAKQ
jgi:hypothetical protein